MIPDSRLFETWPLAPLDEKGLLDWAKRLIVKLQSLKTDPYNVFTETYASTIEYSPSYANILRLTTVHATGNCTINARTGRVGPVWIIITNDATSGKTITFGTGFTSAGTLSGTASKTAVIGFISDGSSLFEMSRITGL